jgi:hypothetical protein
MSGHGIHSAVILSISKIYDTENRSMVLIFQLFIRLSIKQEDLEAEYSLNHMNGNVF